MFDDLEGTNSFRTQLLSGEALADVSARVGRWVLVVYRHQRSCYICALPSADGGELHPDPLTFLEPVVDGWNFNGLLDHGKREG